MKKKTRLQTRAAVRKPKAKRREEMQSAAETIDMTFPPGSFPAPKPPTPPTRLQRFLAFFRR